MSLRVGLSSAARGARGAAVRPALLSQRAGGQQLAARALRRPAHLLASPAGRWLSSAAQQPKPSSDDAGGSGDGLAADPGAPSALAVNNALAIQEKTPFQQKLDDLKNSAFQSDLYARMQAAKEDMEEAIEESDSMFGRVARRVQGLFAENEHARALAQVQKHVPEFDPYSFQQQLMDSGMVESVLQAYLRGDLELLAKVCSPKGLAFQRNHVEQRMKLGVTMDDRILDLRNIEVVEAMMLDDGEAEGTPSLIVSFQAQQVNVFYKPGTDEIKEGDEDDIQEVFYRWIMQLDKEQIWAREEAEEEASKAAQQRQDDAAESGEGFKPDDEQAAAAAGEQAGADAVAEPAEPAADAAMDATAEPSPVDAIPPEDETLAQKMKRLLAEAEARAQEARASGEKAAADAEEEEGKADPLAFLEDPVLKGWMIADAASVGAMSKI